MAAAEQRRNEHLPIILQSYAIFSLFFALALAPSLYIYKLERALANYIARFPFALSLSNFCTVCPFSVDMCESVRVCVCACVFVCLCVFVRVYACVCGALSPTSMKYIYVAVWNFAICFESARAILAQLQQILCNLTATTIANVHKFPDPTTALVSNVRWSKIWRRRLHLECL